MGDAMNMRGSVPRRVPRKPVEARPVVVNQIVATPTFVDCGEILVPANGSVKAFTWRFPTKGVVEDASIEIKDMADGSGLMVHCFYGDELVNGFSVPSAGVYRVGSIPVNSEDSVAIHLVRHSQEEDIPVSMNLAFTFRATNGTVHTPA